MADFEQRLQQALDRGVRQSEKAAQDRLEHQLSEEELRRLHADFRLELSDHIEACLRKLADYVPGFRVRTALGDGGWGGQADRNDFGLTERGERGDFFSRLEVSVRPFSVRHVVDVVCKATVRNKEILHRSVFQRLPKVDVASLKQSIDAWVLEFAEKYASRD